MSSSAASRGASAGGSEARDTKTKPCQMVQANSGRRQLPGSKSARFAMRGAAEKTAGVIVGPMMIGADDTLLIAAAARHHRAAMAADIGESPDHAIPAVDDDHGLVANPDGHVVAGRGHLLAPADADPFAHEQLLAFQSENAGIRIEGARHRAGLVIGQVCGILAKPPEAARGCHRSCLVLPSGARAMPWRLSGTPPGRGRHAPWPSSRRP